MQFKFIRLAVLPFILLPAIAFLFTQANQSVSSSNIRHPTRIGSSTVVTWNGSQDKRWSNPQNWDGGRVPGPSDTARFTKSSGLEMQIDRGSSGVVGGLEMQSDFHGTITLERDLIVNSELLQLLPGETSSSVVIN